MDIIRIIFSILLPPLGVFLQVGIGAQLAVQQVVCKFRDPDSWLKNLCVFLVGNAVWV
jgi:hypothetical protein